MREHCYNHRCGADKCVYAIIALAVIACVLVDVLTAPTDGATVSDPAILGSSATVEPTSKVRSHFSPSPCFALGSDYALP
jgi:hypothetical protein